MLYSRIKYIDLHILFHITKLIETMLYKASYFHPYINNNCVCMYMYGPTYVYTYVILYMQLMFSPACTYNKTGINESNDSEFLWICCSQIELANLNITPRDRVTITPRQWWGPFACSHFSDLAIAGLCTMCIDPYIYFRTSWDNWASWSS